MGFVPLSSLTSNSWYFINTNFGMYFFLCFSCMYQVNNTEAAIPQITHEQSADFPLFTTIIDYCLLNTISYFCNAYVCCITLESDAIGFSTH